MTTPPPDVDFTIAWICPSRLELVAAREMFDHAYGKHPQILHPSDANAYESGKIGRNNVAMACLPSAFATRHLKIAIYGAVETVYKQMKTVLLPQSRHLRSRYLHLLTTAAHALTADRALNVPCKIPSFLSKMFEWYPEKRAVYAYPGVADDVLFRTDYSHRSHRSQRNHSERSVVPRPAREDCTRPGVHSETITAIDKPVADVRAGSHGDGRWRGYAAATAAAYAKELLETLTALPRGEIEPGTF
ncbi:hypothetical protein BDW71DRAFT_207888 [Aspergillus fruticulosus]